MGFSRDNLLSYLFYASLYALALVSKAHPTILNYCRKLPEVEPAPESGVVATLFGSGSH